MLSYFKNFARACGVSALAMVIGKLGGNWRPFKKRIRGETLGTLLFFHEIIICFNVACYISAATNCIYSALCEDVWNCTY